MVTLICLVFYEGVKDRAAKRTFGCYKKEVRANVFPG